MKSIFDFLAIIIVIIATQIANAGLFDGTQGTGTANDPYRIYTKIDLEELADSTNKPIISGTPFNLNKHYSLMNDITYPVTQSIGASSANNRFYGYFNGNGFSIHLNLNDGGLFRYAGGNISWACVISDLIVCGTVTGQEFAGGIAGFNINATIENCLNIANIYATDGYAGGIAGRTTNNPFSIISNCINSGYVNGRTGSGGIIGFNDQLGHFPLVPGGQPSRLFISNCINTGVVEGNNDIGAITGEIGRAILENCHYDKQMCIYGGVNGVDVLGTTAHLTKDIVGDKLASILGTADWIYTDGDSLYPQLKVFQNHIASKVGASPMYLDVLQESDDYDTYNNIRHCYRINTSNNVVWTKFQANIISIEGNDVYLKNLGTDTMYATLGEAMKTVPIIVTDTLCSIDTFNLTLLTNPDTIGTADTSGRYETGTLVRIVATEEDCYSFVNWTDTEGNIISEKQIDTILLISDSILIANFVRDSFELVLNIFPENTGTAALSGYYACGDTIQIEAVAEDCYHFANWTDAEGIVIAETEIYSIIIRSDTNLTANFERDSFELVLNIFPENTGTTILSDRYACGDTIEIEAVAEDCYHFLNWTNANGTIISNTAKHQIIIRSDSVLTANFVRDSFNVILSVNPVNTGTATILDENVSVGRYACGDTIRIEAIADECYEFMDWTNLYTGFPISFNSLEAIIIRNDTFLVANFEYICDTAQTDTFNLTLHSSPENTGTATGSGNYPKDRRVRIVAVPQECYKFVNWTDIEGNIISEKQIDTVILISDSVLTANFVRDSFYVALRTNPEGAGVVIPHKLYACGDTIEIDVTPNDCYNFVNWTDKNGEVSKNEKHIVIVSRDTLFTANFTNNSFDLVLNVNPANTGTVTGSGRYGCNEEVEISAIADSCYEFINWTDAVGEIISENAIHTIIMIENTILTANFDYICDTAQTDTFTLTLYTAPEDAGTTTGSGKYAKDRNVRIAATADSCYQFVNWTDLYGNVISERRIDTIIIVCDTSLTANFQFICDTSQVPDTFNLILLTNVGNTTGSGSYEAGSIAIIDVFADTCYQFINWTDLSGKVISVSQKDTITIITDSTLTANFEYICPLEITIIASKHDSIVPILADYHIPIYIKSNKDIAGYTIEKLVLEIDKSIFFPKSTNNGGNWNNSNGTITINNILVPPLKAGVETELLTIRGDILLGDKDSSAIDLQEVIVADSTYFTLEDGYITLKICTEGGDRLLTNVGYSPSITITTNPVTDMLDVECKVVEIGSYSLEIVDLSGMNNIHKKWFVNKTDALEYTFTIPVLQYSTGSYIIIMRTPTDLISEKFIIKR
ncbi:MAG: hypothetical protein FWG85_01990 [Bacteroidetes bacterium]|nr:hypothetical protein [Bacteroidota bacterium]